MNLGAGGRYLDRPTVTHSPLTGPDFIKTMMTPFPPDSVMFLIEAGWPVDQVLRMGTQAVNGLRNQKAGPYGHHADPGFRELLGLLQKIQLSGGIGMTMEKAKGGEAASTLLLFHTRHLTPEIAEDVLTVRRLLNLNPEAKGFKITYGADAQADDEIAIHTRSGFQLMAEVAARISVPPEHLAEERTIASRAAGAEEKFVLFTLSESGQKVQPPVLTIRANKPKGQEALPDIEQMK